MSQIPDFTTQDTWRVFRIMSEFVEGFEALADVGPAVSVFGSARTPRHDPYYVKARRLGKMLAQRSIAVITGGGPGIMEAANRGAREGGGLSIGLNITLPNEQIANPYADRRIDFRYFFARLVMFVRYACAFVCFPGGYGTLHEFFNSMCLIQTGKAEAFPVVLVGREFWKGLIAWMRKDMLKWQHPMISAEDLDLFRVTDDLHEAAAIIENARQCRASRQPRPLAATVHSPTAEGTVAGQPARVRKKGTRQ